MAPAAYNLPFKCIWDKQERQNRDTSTDVVHLVLLCGYIFTNKSVKPDLSVFSGLEGKWKKKRQWYFTTGKKKGRICPRFALFINEDLYENCMGLSLLPLKSHLASPKVNIFREQTRYTILKFFFSCFTEKSELFPADYNSSIRK